MQWKHANFIWRQIDIDSLTFHAAHVPMYLDYTKLMSYIAHKKLFMSAFHSFKQVSIDDVT